MREQGRVEWFDRELKYGFIAREGHPDIFVHWSKIIRDGEKFLSAGDIVEFEVKEVVRTPSKEKKLQAFDVVLIKSYSLNSGEKTDDAVREDK